MYDTIKISELDQQTHRFLWRDMNLNVEPNTRVMTSVSFGDRPASSISAVALRRTAELNKEKYSEAAEVIISNTYVDDIIDSFDDEKQCREIAEEIDVILKSGSFKIKERCISGKDVDNHVNNALNADQKILGMIWDKELDVFRFQVQKNPFTE